MSANGFNILLLNHPQIRSLETRHIVVNTPLASSLISGYITAMLHANGLNAELIEADDTMLSMEETINLILSKEALLLGVNLVYSFENTDKILDALRIIKHERPVLHLTIYGFYPTFMYNELIKEYKFIDSIIVGEAEITFLHLAQRLVEGKGLKGIKGLVYRRDREDVIISSPSSLIYDLDSIPFPVRQLETVQNNNMFYILGSRGCYNQCNFCYINNFYNKKSYWRGRSPKNIINEIKILSKYTDRFYFADASFFGQGEMGKCRAIELADSIVNELPFISFGFECRPNDIEKESLRQLVSAGLKWVFLGVESGCQSSLDFFKKDITVDIIKKAINLIREFDIKLSIGFIIFHPYSTIKDIIEDFNFLLEMGLLDSVSTTAHLLYHHLVCYRGTDIYKHFPSSSYAYEYNYPFFDPKVERLYNTMHEICNNVLTACNYNDLNDERQVVYKEINDILINGFASMIFLIEKDSHYDIIYRNELRLREQIKELIKEIDFNSVL